MTCTLILQCFLLFSVGFAASSYLDVPRINFEGRFHADVATNNNERLNFLFSSVRKEDMLLDGKGSFNQLGTNTWKFVDCKVTSVVKEKGTILTTDDPVIGLPIVTNPNTASAKIVDIDVDDQLLSSVIYGMKLGINFNQFEPRPNSFIGDFKPAVIASDFWVRQAENPEAYYQQRIGTRIVSRIENVTFLGHISSDVLQSFQKDLKTEGVALSIRFALFNYSKNPSDNWFTYGNVVGSIGLSYPDESLQFPESRVMTFLGNPPIKVDPISKGCKNIKDWMHGAYFNIDFDKSRISIDMSNSFAIGIEGNICKLHKLYLGVTDSNSKITIIKEIPYMDETWYNKGAGILEVDLDSTIVSLVKNHEKVVVVSANTYFETDILSGQKYPMCHKSHIVSNNIKSLDRKSSCSSDSLCQFDVPCVYILLEETSCMVRPMDMFIQRMEKNQKEEIKLKMTYFGEKRSGKTIQLIDQSPNGEATEKDLTYKRKVDDYMYITYSDSSKKNS